jgi:antitoxin (DNA-binding transcriptional repressor) of toxin-antitoxin stability system
MTKTRLSKLTEAAAIGKDGVIGRGGKPMARRTRLNTPKRRLKFGVLKGKFKVPEDFDAPL